MSGCSWFRCLAALPLLAVLAGCASLAAPTSNYGTLDVSLPQLRALAAETSDPSSQARLAEAELLRSGGDARSGERALVQALEAGHRTLRALLLHAMVAEAHGRPDLGFAALLEALPLAAASTDPLAAAMAEVAVRALADLQGAVEGYARRLVPILAEVEPSLPWFARFSAHELMMRLAHSRGDVGEEKRIAQRAGCIVEALTTEPWGPHSLLGFDEDFEVNPIQPLRAFYDLGPGRGVRETRRVTARGCTLSLGGGPLAKAGTRFVQFPVRVESAGEYALRVDTPNNVEVYVAGRSVLRVDRRSNATSRVQVVPVSLQVGQTLVTVKVTSRHPNPALSMALQATPVRGVEGMRGVALPAVTQSQPSGVALFLRTALQVQRGDIVHARHELASRIDGDEAASALFLMQRAALALADPLLPNAKRNDEAKVFLTRALQRDPLLWSPALQLASQAASHGQVVEAIDAVRKLAERFPKVAALGLQLAQWQQDKGWESDAQQQIARIRKLVPDACIPIKWELERLLAKKRFADATPLEEAHVACEAGSNSRYMGLLRRRDWKGAGAELQRLAELGGAQLHYAYLSSALELAKQRQDSSAEKRLIDAMRQAFPLSEAALLDEAEWHFARGDRMAAQVALRTGLLQEPGSFVELHRVLPVFGGQHPLSKYRRDGIAEIQAFEGSGLKFDAPQVLVFDYLAVQVFDDGSSLELVHTIQKAQSSEAVDELAEVAVPQDARVQTLRVIKRDGTALEADIIDGKDTLSLPGMELGDYVEFEFTRALPSADGFPGGYLGERFYFQSYEVPFEHSELVVIAPKSMPLVVDARGKAPPVQVETQGEQTLRRFVVKRSRPLVAEPGSVSAREFVPSVRLGARAQWSHFVASLRDLLSDRNVADPEMAELTQRIVGEAGVADYGLRAERIYAYVLDEIEHDDDLLSQAAIMVRAGRGNRARVMHYLLRLAGVPADLVLVRGADFDQTQSDLPDLGTYEHLLVRVGGAKLPTYLFAPETHAPFGYVPSLLQGQDGLVLVSPLEKIRVPVAEEGRELRKLEVDVELLSGGNVEVHVVERLRGAGAMAWRRDLEGIPVAQLERRFEQSYVARLLPGAQLKSLEITGRERRGDDLVLKYDVVVEGFARKTETGWALPSLLPDELAANYATLSGRTTTLYTGARVESELVVRYHFAKGLIPFRAPEQAKESGLGGLAKFEQGIAMREGFLQVTRRLRIPSVRIEPDAYPEFAAFCRSVDELESREVEVAQAKATRKVEVAQAKATL